MCPAKTARESQKPNSNDRNYIDGKKTCYGLGFLAQGLIAQQEDVQSMTMLQKNSRSITLVTIYVNYVCSRMQKIMK